LILGLGAGGCAGADKATVTGEVIFDGKPLKEGVIRFVPVNGQSPTASGNIVDGRFSVTVPVGEQRVQISAPKVVGKHKVYDTPESPYVDEVAELLPACYNARSELTLTVEVGAQEKRFDLQKK